jgi:bifunctional non-homologous end joining protein LigD
VSPEECRLAGEVPAASPPAAAPPPALAGRVLAKKNEIERELFAGSADNATIEIEGKRLRLTNLNKLYFPESGYRKRDLLAYYYRIADRLLPFLRQRPLVLRRYPDGITGESFFQKEAGEAAPEWMQTLAVHSDERGQPIRYFLANDLAALLYLTNLGCIDHNPWASRRDALDLPDYVFFDLDPSEGTEFDTVVAVARGVWKKLESLGIVPFVKTSGATGMHLYVPLERRYTYEQARTFAEIVGRLVASELPRLTTEERAVAKRPRGRVYIDVSQNALGRPLAAVYTVRAFPRAPVSAPLEPGELRPGLRPERFNLKSILAWVDKKGDLWAGFWQKRQSLESATALLSEAVARRRGR